MRIFLNWSISSLLFPFFLALYFELWLTMSILAIAIGVTFIYHASREKLLGKCDTVLAYALIASNIRLCYLGGFAYPYFAITTLLVVAALYLYFVVQKTDYCLGHGLWHTASATITIFSILTYLQR